MYLLVLLTTDKEMQIDPQVSIPVAEWILLLTKNYDTIVDNVIVVRLNQVLTVKK